MALLELAELTQDPRYTNATAHSLAWIHGNNELNHNMTDPQNGIVHRSIRRKHPHNKLSTRTKTLSHHSPASHPNQPPHTTPKPTQPTAPYHFGWVLEAWTGRENTLNHYSTTT